MSFEVRADARRATSRLYATYIIATTVIAGVVLPLVARAFADPAAGTAELQSFLVIGAFVYAGGFLLAYVIGFLAGGRARRAGAMLRARGDTTAISFGYLAPENPVVALTVKPGELGAWTDEYGELVALGTVSNIETVALTAHRIWGSYYYALEVASADSRMLIALGTRTTWGVGTASRRAHMRLARTLLGEPKPENVNARSASRPT